MDNKQDCMPEWENNENTVIECKWLASIVPDKRKIWFYTFLRIAFVTLIVFAGIRSNPLALPSDLLRLFLVLLIVALVLIWVFFPLIHLKDYMIFFNTGIEINKRKYNLGDLGEIIFLEHKSGIFSKYYMRTDIKDFNITYMKDVRKTFNRAYLHTI